MESFFTVRMEAEKLLTPNSTIFLSLPLPNKLMERAGRRGGQSTPSPDAEKTPTRATPRG